ncbi:B-cell lymphoma 3 protein [Discoglossus pictus]
MDTPNNLCSEKMETSSPLDLSIPRNMSIMNVTSRSPLEVQSGGSLRDSESNSTLKLEETFQSAEEERGSVGETGLCKDQACLPLRKRRYPPSPKEEGPLRIKADQCSGCARKYYAPYMTVSVPTFYQGGSAAYVPSTIPFYPAPASALLNGPLLGLLPHHHPALLPHDTQLLADITAATQSDEDGDTALHIAVVHENISAAGKVITLLLHGGMSLDILNNLRQTPLHLAVITDQPALVSILLAHGSSPQIPDRNGQTCVHLACEYASAGSLEVLLKAGKWDLESTNYQGMTALHVAIGTGRRDITLLLLEHGADVDAVDIKSGHSPLIQAVDSGSEELVALLLQRGAKVNAQTYAGNTALHVASGRGLAEVTRLLLRSGADSGIKNCHNDTAMTVAKDRRIIDILRGKSSSPNAQSEKYRGDIKDIQLWGERHRHSSVSPPP